MIIKNLEAMKEKKIISLIATVEKALRKKPFELSDYILQEVAIQYLNTKGWNIHFQNGVLRYQKLVEEDAGGTVCRKEQ